MFSGWMNNLEKIFVKSQKRAFCYTELLYMDFRNTVLAMDVSFTFWLLLEKSLI